VGVRVAARVVARVVVVVGVRVVFPLVDLVDVRVGVRSHADGRTWKRPTFQVVGPTRRTRRPPSVPCFGALVLRSGGGFAGRVCACMDIAERLLAVGSWRQPGYHLAGSVRRSALKAPAGTH